MDYNPQKYNDRAFDVHFKAIVYANRFMTAVINR